jgi:hypothetical protein
MLVYMRTPWLKRVLIPFWVVRFILLAFLLATLIYEIVRFNAALSQNDVVVSGSPHPPGLMYVSSGLVHTKISHICNSIAYVLVALLSVCLLLDTAAIFLFVLGTLRPLIFLIFNIIQTGIWVTLFVLELVGALQIDDSSSTIYRKYGGWVVSIVGL